MTLCRSRGTNVFEASASSGLLVLGKASKRIDNEKRDANAAGIDSSLCAGRIPLAHGLRPIEARTATRGKIEMKYGV